MSNFTFDGVVFEFIANRDGANIYEIDHNDILITGGAAVCINPNNNEPIVVLHKAIKDVLTPGEYAAMVGHEVGHIKLSHLDSYDLTTINFNIKHEIEADMYSVNQGACPTDMHNAIYKLCEFGSKHSSCNFFVSLALHKERLDALSAI